MNKWILLLAVCFIVLGLAYTVPVTIENPSLSNIGITALMAIFTLIGIKLFYNAVAGPKKGDNSITVNGEKLIPAD